jgi:hypothetical protein
MNLETVEGSSIVPLITGARETSIARFMCDRPGDHVCPGDESLPDSHKSAAPEG